MNDLKSICVGCVQVFPVYSACKKEKKHLISITFQRGHHLVGVLNHYRALFGSDVQPCQGEHVFFGLMWVFPPSKSNTHKNNIFSFPFFFVLFVDFFGHESQPVRWQESARLYWIITPDWFHLVHAPALLIWQSCSSAVRNDAHTKKRREKKRKKESLCLIFFLFFFYYVYSGVFFSSLCIRMSVQNPPSWIIQPPLRL